MGENKMFNRTIVGLATCLLLMGCATLKPNQVSFTVYAEPPGAMLYEGDVSWGMAPQARIYTGDLKVGTIQTKPITAIWPSGARQTQHFNLPMKQGDRQAILSRPKEAPGLDRDLTFAAQLRSIKAQEDAASAASAAAYYQMLNASKPAAPAYPTTTTCMGLGKDMVSCTSQ
jgi:hypothetical protein